jgi:hypothetical protein
MAQKPKKPVLFGETIIYVLQEGREILVFSR